MKEAKIINDPVFGFIKIPRGLLYGIVEHPLFQRLNRINQLDWPQNRQPHYCSTV